jgi:hypothetical protein
MGEVYKACSTRGRIKKTVHYFNTDLKVRVLFGNCESKLDDSIKITLKIQVVVLEMSRPNLAYRYNPEVGGCRKGNELSGFIRRGKFVFQLSDYLIFKKNIA